MTAKENIRQSAKARIDRDRERIRMQVRPELPVVESCGFVGIFEIIPVILKVNYGKDYR
jgi:hypothetical protein